MSNAGTSSLSGGAAKGTSSLTSTNVIFTDPGLRGATLTPNFLYPATLDLPDDSVALDAGSLEDADYLTDEIGTPRTTLPDLGAWQHTAGTSTITVTSTADTADSWSLSATSVPGNDLGSVTLRDAINLADNAGGTSTIVLASGATYDFTTADNNWYGPDALPPVASNITILGNGSTLERASSLDADTTADGLRFFYVSGGMATELPLGTLDLENLTLQNGLAKGGDAGGGGGGLGAGGAIFNQGDLTLNGVTLAGNEALGGSYVVSFGESSGGGGMGQDGARSRWWGVWGELSSR